MCAWRRDNWKLIWKPEEPGRPESWELYDLSADPGETHNVAAIQVEITEQLRVEMLESTQASRRKLERFAQGTAVEMDAELRANLRALGYLGDEN
jgi:arylsulfatase A-like enzyme